MITFRVGWEDKAGQVRSGQEVVPVSVLHCYHCYQVTGVSGGVTYAG